MPERDANAEDARQAAEPLLTNSIRTLDKGTHVRITAQEAPVGGALRKLSYVRQLALQPGDVAAVRSALSDSPPARSPNLSELGQPAPAETDNHHLDRLLTAFEGAPIPALLPSAHEFAAIDAERLAEFGAALIGLRRQAAITVTADDEHRAIAQQTPQSAAVSAAALSRLVGAVTAHKTFTKTRAVCPLGMLNLERLEMTPAGIERGGLIATIPLAPLEQTAVVQKEWSVVSKEFTTIVTDSLENYSETGVTDNTELSQATTAQLQHANQANITASVSGGIPLLISASATGSVTAQDASSTSATESRRQATEITHKAASRTRQEHKVTISTKTETGTSETTTRTLQNPSSTDALRVDYFSLMRKWKVRLYRYGLRLTYDVVIPEPGATLRQEYAQLDNLHAAQQPFMFSVSHDEITTAVRKDLKEAQPHYLVLAEKYRTSVPPPPSHPDVVVDADIPDHDSAEIFTTPPIVVPDGFQISHLWLTGHSDSKTHEKLSLNVFGSTYAWVKQDFWNGSTDVPHGGDLADPGNGGLLLHRSGSNAVTFEVENNRQTHVSLRAELEPTPAALDGWRNDVWNALFNGAQAAYVTEQQDILRQIDAIEARLNGVDTLTLRREESAEIMKSVLQFLLGPDYQLMPPMVRLASLGSEETLRHGVRFTGARTILSEQAWTILTQHEDVVRFVNEAIEWENVSTFLYPYFWDVPEAWQFIRNLRHPDATREAFLRAGGARVVLTIRRGYEADWVKYAEGGFRKETIGSDHPYLKIAQRIAAYDHTNYPGIPPANPARGDSRLQDAVYTTSSSDLAVSGDPQTIEVADARGFVPALDVVLGSPGGPDQERVRLSPKPRPDDTHLVVIGVTQAHGHGHEYAVVQPGEKGVLIAEWEEYTPTSGTDIKLSSDLATIA